MPTLDKNDNYKKIADIIRSLSNKWGLDFYRSITSNVAHVLQADYTFIARLSDDGLDATTLALFNKDKLIDNISYALSGSPCEQVASDGQCTYSNDVCQHFPDDHLLKELNIKAYIGVPLYDREHKVLGILTCLFTKPLTNTVFIHSVLELFSGRIAAEIESTEKTQHMEALNHAINLKNEALNLELRRSLDLQINLEKMITHDPLTGLNNRHQFLLDIEKIDPSESYWIIKSGIDNLKNLNQTFGHEKGDLLLQEFAKRCRRLADMEPTIRVYRWVSDEFLYLIQSTDLKHIIKSRAFYDTAFQLPYYIGKLGIQVSTSEGLACLNDFDSVDDAIAAADMAMEKVKQRGGDNMLAYDESMEKSNERFFDIHAALRQAMLDNLLCAFYQPIYNMDSQKIVGFETLMRWIEKDGTIKFGPWEFIPVAENTGQIIHLGKQIIKESIQQLNQWILNNHHYHLSINLSPMQFYDDDLLPFIDDLMLDYPNVANMIRFEVTESIFVKDSDLVLNKLNALKERGFKLALDDFGTGYSSLSYIQQYPFDFIKIDKCFIDNIVSDNPEEAKKSRILVQAVILLSTGLDMEVIAEGIEDKEQSDLLHSMGVKMIQGYYYGKPMPANEIETRHHSIQ